MNTQWTNNDLYEYTIYSLQDSSSGGTDINRLNQILNHYSKSGWRMKQIITNELGHNSAKIGYGGLSVGTNATIDQLVIIFERKVSTGNDILNSIEQKRIQEQEKREQEERELEKRQQLVDNRNLDSFLQQANFTDGSRIKTYYIGLSDRQKQLTIHTLFTLNTSSVGLYDLVDSLNDYISPNTSTYELMIILQNLLDEQFIELANGKYSLLKQ